MTKKQFTAAFFAIICFIISQNLRAQQISPMLFGQNAWMPDSIGSVKYYGQLHKKWADIKNSSSTVIRFGGIGPDKDKPTNYQYIQMIDSIRAKGMEPIMQVPFYMNKYSSSQAADIVKFVNVTMKRNIKYWIIGNEPDHVYKYTSSSQVAPYLRSFASAMKDADPSILTIGPECAWYNTGILKGLTTPGGPDDVTGKNSKGLYYIDLISFHTYPFNGSQTRDDAIFYLTKAGKLGDNLKELNARLDNCNSFHNREGSKALKIAITEANISYQNSSSDGIYGTGAMSFLGGQFWAEILAVCMQNKVEIFNFWSVVEGNSVALNIGYIDKYNGRAQPTYHHFKMMAEHFKGSYILGIDNQDKVKAFGSKNSSDVSVMIMNQSTSSNHHFTLKLNGSSVSGNDPLKINLDATINAEYTDIIENQTTLLLVFDLTGKLTKKCTYNISEHANKNLPPNCSGSVPAVVNNPTPLNISITADGPTTICEGNSVVLKTSSITGATYQWKKEGNNISGATSSSYTANSSGTFTLEVKNAGAIGLSNAIAIISETFKASITTNDPTTINSGGSVAMNANTGAGYIYQWKKDGVNISGATISSYKAYSSGDYQVKITNGNCVAWSAPLKVTVIPALNVSISASGPTTFCAGGSVILKSDPITGATYQWKKDANNIGGAVSNTYTVSLAGSYTLEVKSNGTVAISNPINVNIEEFQAIISTSEPTTFCIGGSVTLNANTGNGYIYQWKRNGSNITGATLSSYKATSAGDYQVKIINGNCTAWSSPTLVSISNSLKANIFADGPTTFCEGGYVVLKADQGTGYTYQWRKDGINISGATSYEYTALKAGKYDLRIKQGTCDAYSTPISVSISKSLKATITPNGPLNFPNGQSLILSANMGSGFKYQWKKNGANITGATNSTYTVTNSGEYQVKIVNGTCAAWSAPVKVTVYTATLTGTGPIQTEEGDGNDGFDDAEPSGLQTINSEIFEPSIKAYPNPTSGPLTISIELSENLGNELTLEIYNAIGQAIYNKVLKVNDAVLNDFYQFDDHHSAGIYYIRVHYGDKFFTEKILLNK